MTAEHLAAARRTLTAAEAEQATAATKRDRIAARIAECQQRQREITTQRLEGEASPQTASEFAALSGDISELTIMLAQQNEVLDAATTRTDSARNNLAEADRRHTAQQNQAAFEELALRSLKLDAALCRSIAELHALGKQLGRNTLSQNWRPSQALDRAARLGVPPEI